jgi:hypothetical protein
MVSSHLDLNGDEKYILGILELLEDLGWMKRGLHGEYVLTGKGKTEPQDFQT